MKGQNAILRKETEKSNDHLLSLWKLTRLESRKKIKSKL